MNHFRIILAASAGVAALAIGVPIAAHPEHSTTNEVREVKTVTKDGDKTIEIHKVVKGDKAGGVEIDEGTFVANCGEGRKFESVAKTGDGDKQNVNKIVLCADKDESQAQWEKTLRDALARLEANKDMPSEGKAKIMADLRSEIAKTGK
jgi:hypothetical protein